VINILSFDFGVFLPTQLLKVLGWQLALCAMRVENIFPHHIDTISIREADICATLLATLEMMDLNGGHNKGNHVDSIATET
jgi:hypothetical protein